MRSHQFAERLKATAEFLLSRPEVELGWREEYEPTIYISYMNEKESFLQAARAFGSGRKSYDQWDMRFTPKNAPQLQLSISRSAVCRKVQEEKWECEPLLSDEEAASIEA